MRSVDEQMTQLNPEENWRPDTVGALARFRERRRVRGRRIARQWVWAAGAAAVICAGLLAYPHAWKSGETAASMRSLKDGSAAPEFALKDAGGAEVRLSDYRGKAVVLNFWATWCRPCREEMPMLAGFESRYMADGLQVIGVSLDDDGWKSVVPFLGKTPVNYPVVIASGEVATRYGVEAMPMTVLIDREGKVAGMHLGTVKKDVWEAEIGRLLGE